MAALCAVATLCQSLQLNRRLTSLDLSNNALTYVSALHLAGLLGACAGLCIAADADTEAGSVAALTLSNSVLVDASGAPSGTVLQVDKASFLMHGTFPTHMYGTILPYLVMLSCLCVCVFVQMLLWQCWRSHFQVCKYLTTEPVSATSMAAAAAARCGFFA